MGKTDMNKSAKVEWRFDTRNVCTRSGASSTCTRPGLKLQKKKRVRKKRKIHVLDSLVFVCVYSHFLNVLYILYSISLSCLMFLHPVCYYFHSEYIHLSSQTINAENVQASVLSGFHSFPKSL